ncbi:YggS family pyridoxal phosphate-dependent enzyme [Aquimarina rhabdastrellae]
MTPIKENLNTLNSSIPNHVTLVAVSKTKPVTAIQEAYNAGHRVFGENKIQEMTTKWETLPKDISWHMIGHVQTNKVKYMAPYVDLIHAVDSLKLLKEIHKQGQKHDRTISCLLQLKIAQEDSKHGLTENQINDILSSPEIRELSHVRIVGLMGMASFTADQDQIKSEFGRLKTFYDQLVPDFPQLQTLSMGMSGDYALAIAQGSTMVRIGSAIFGARNYNH